MHAGIMGLGKAVSSPDVTVTHGPIDHPDDDNGGVRLGFASKDGAL